MASLSLKISIPSSSQVKTLMFDKSMMVLDACKFICEKLPDVASQVQVADFGLLLTDEDPAKGIWLDNARTLEYYLLKSGDMLEFRKKTRPLRVKMMDGSLKTVLINDSNKVEDLVLTICERVGIANPQEYSLMKEDESEKSESKRRGSISGTDENLQWLQSDKTLREQGISDSTVLMLRLKFWGKSIDQNDPVQLNLLCAEARTSVLQGSHPVKEAEAIQFAALQAQEHYGNFDGVKAKSNSYSNITEFLPFEYAKTKGIETHVLAEYSKLTGLTETNAKLRYIQLFRSLKTYGVSFFHVKEKVKGKNRLMSRWLGVARDNIMRMDMKSKEVLKTWPLTTVRRWAASPNSFTLDFGDYSESYYSVQTSEGEAISQLIAGYIDIILKRNKALSQASAGGQTVDIAAMEQALAASRKAAVQQTSGVQQVPAAMQLGRMEEKPSPQVATVSHTTSAAQSALSKGINTTLGMISNLLPDLQKAADLPPIGADPASVQWKQDQIDLKRQNVSSQVTAVAASAAQVIRLTSGDQVETNYTAVGSAVTTISSNLAELAKGVRMLAALTEKGDSESILAAARNLASSTQILLKAVLPEENASRQQLLSAAGETGGSCGKMLKAAGEQQASEQYQEDLMTLAKEVATTTQGLVQHVKQVAAACEDKQIKSDVVNATKLTASSTSHLVACSKTVACCISSPLAQNQLLEAAKTVATAVDSIVNCTQKACQDDALLQKCGEAATAVTTALNNLVSKLQEESQPVDAATNRHNEACDAILEAIERLFSSLGDPAEMVKQARALATASSHLVTALKEEAQSVSSDPVAQQRVVSGAKKLADSTSKMVESAKNAAMHPNDGNAQQKLRKATEDLRTAVNAAAGNILRKRVVRRLGLLAKQSAESCTQLIAAAQGAAASNRLMASQQQLNVHSKDVGTGVASLVGALRVVMVNPDIASAQLNLIHSSQHLVQPATKLVASCKAAVPTIGDQAAALQLGIFAKATAAVIGELRNAAAKALDMCGSLELDGAMHTIQTLMKDVDEVVMVIRSGKLMPLPGETQETASLELGITTKTFGSSMAQLLTAAAQSNENYTGVAARDVASSLKVVYTAGRGVAAGFQNQREAQETLMSACKSLMEHSLKLLTATKANLAAPNAPESKADLAAAAKAVQQALGSLFGCLPSVRDVDAAMKTITSQMEKLRSGKFPSSSESSQQLQMMVNESAAALNAASTGLVVASRGGSTLLATSAEKFATSCTEVLNMAMKIAGSLKNKGDRAAVVDAATSTATSANKLLLTSKQVAAHPEAANAKAQLQTEAKNVTESINVLLGRCSSATPGQKECENALRNMQAAGAVLQSLNQHVSDMTFADCQEAVRYKATVLGETMLHLPTLLKKREMDKFGSGVTETGELVCSLIEAGAQSAYLIGISDPTSTAGTSGLVDTTKVAVSQQAIANACQVLLAPKGTQKQVLEAATSIAKHTASLCTVCKMAAQGTRNEVARQHFVQSARDVAMTTGELVKAIKSLAASLTDGNRAKCSEASKPLVKTVDDFAVFASSPEFASSSAQISAEARISMKPVISAAEEVLSSSIGFVTAAKNLCGNFDDAPTWQLLAMHSKKVSEAVRKLLEDIIAKAPGQRECESALDQMRAYMNTIDQATLGAISNTLPSRADSTLQGFCEKVVNSLVGIEDSVGGIVSAAKTDPTKLGHQVTLVSSHGAPLVDGLVGAASKTKEQKRQLLLLNHGKTVVESLLELIVAAQAAGGHDADSKEQREVSKAARNVQDASQDLTATVQSSSQVTGDGSMMVNTLEGLIQRVDDPLMVEPDKSFVEYQERLMAATRKLMVFSQEVIGKASGNPEAMRPLLNQLAKLYSGLTADGRAAIACTEQEDLASRIKQSMKSVGESLTDIVSNAMSVAENPSDSYFKQELSSSCRALSEKVSFFLAALQAGSRGTQACLNGISSLANLISDLETTAMFAAAGTLMADGPNDTFSEHRDGVILNARSFVEDTKKLVSGAAGSQEQLAGAAQNIIRTAENLSMAAKSGAAAMGVDDKEGQVLMLQSTRDVLAALSSLLDATKNASGKSVNDPEMEQLKQAAKIMVTSVSSLLKTVKMSEDEAVRGGRALESTIEALDQEVQLLRSPEPPTREASAMDLIHATKAITMSTARAVSTSTSMKQSELTALGNVARKAIGELLATCKAAAAGAENDQHRDMVIEAGLAVAHTFRLLLENVFVLTQKQSYDKKQKMPELSKAVANAVSDVIQAAEVLKGTDWVNPDDPSVIAENELLAAASAIEAAAKKLTILKPRKAPSQADEDLPFDQQILEAAKAITAATGALVKSATQAQRELVAQGKVQSPTKGGETDEFGQWSQGLISAAQMVALATSTLCEAAGAMVQGGASEERLIASAKTVAKSTAQLLVACMIKADPNGTSVRRLQEAGNAVKNAAENLVKAAQRAAEVAADEEAIPLSKRKVGSIAQEIEAQEMIFKKERELDLAKRQLDRLRKSKYAALG